MNRNLITKISIALFCVLMSNTASAQGEPFKVLSQVEINAISVATRKSCQLASFPIGFTIIEDHLLGGQFNMAGSEAGSGEFDGCEKSKYVFDDKKVEIYHDGEKIVAVKRIFIGNAVQNLFEKTLFPGSTDLRFRVLTFLFLLELPKLTGKDLSEVKGLGLSIAMLEGMVNDIRQLSVGKIGDTWMNTRLTIWRKQDVLEVEFLPQKTFLQFKRKGVKR